MDRNYMNFLPDEIISNILIRLPVKTVMICRLVCKRFRDLTINPEFVELHPKITTCILVASSLPGPTLNLISLDGWWEEDTVDRSRYDIYFSKGSFRVSLSHCGLIVLEEQVTGFLPRQRFVIFNPTRPMDERVRITLLSRGLRMEIYGVYYHPLMKQYCILLNIRLTEYGVLYLGCKPSLKKIKNPFRYRYKKKDSHPVSINNCIYWLLKSVPGDYRYKCHNDILEFDIMKEEFTLIPCPVIPLNTECGLVIRTHLFTIDDVLHVMLIGSSNILTWRLEDGVDQKLWRATEYTVSREIVKLNERVGGMNGVVGVDGKLALPKYNEFHVCNLVEGTILRNNNAREMMPLGHLLYFPHQMSLASLGNCKSEIRISKDLKLCTRD